jgi:hypothetical protein
MRSDQAGLALTCTDNEPVTIHWRCLTVRRLYFTSPFAARMLPVAEALRSIDIDRSYLDINGSELFGEAFLNDCSSSVSLSRTPHLGGAESIPP